MARTRHGQTRNKATGAMLIVVIESNRTQLLRVHVRCLICIVVNMHREPILYVIALVNSSLLRVE
jgi:hypothetical protein